MGQIANKTAAILPNDRALKVTPYFANMPHPIFAGSLSSNNRCAVMLSYYYIININKQKQIQLN